MDMLSSTSDDEVGGYKARSARSELSERSNQNCGGDSRVTGRLARAIQGRTSSINHDCLCLSQGRRGGKVAEPAS